jgi:hypothetical protein
MDFKMDLDGGSPAMIKSMKLNVCTLAWCTPAMGGGLPAELGACKAPWRSFRRRQIICAVIYAQIMAVKGLYGNHLIMLSLYIRRTYFLDS